MYVLLLKRSIQIYRFRKNRTGISKIRFFEPFVFFVKIMFFRSLRIKIRPALFCSYTNMSLDVGLDRRETGSSYPTDDFCPGWFRMAWVYSKTGGKNQDTNTKFGK